MKIGIAFIKKDKKDDETTFIIQYDKEFKLSKTTKEHVFIKTNTDRSEQDNSKRVIY